MDLLVTCTCGHRMTVSEFAAGMTAPCPACGKPLTVSPANATPVERRPAPPPAPAITPSVGASDIAYTPLRTASLKSHCARCGREFRGDWDRHPSAAGLVCNICNNFVASSAIATQSSGYVAPVDSMKLDPVLDPVPAAPIEVEVVEKDWREKYMPDNAMMQRIAVGAAVAFGLYTVWLLISGAWEVPPAPEDIEAAAAVATAAELPKLPLWAGIAMTVLSGCSGFVSTCAGIYIFLMLGNRLPEDSFLANIIRILPAAVLITALGMGASMFSASIIGVVIAIFFVAPIVFVFFGFEAQDIINYPLAMFLAGVLQSMCLILIYWVIGAVAL